MMLRVTTGMPAHSEVTVTDCIGEAPPRPVLSAPSHGSDPDKTQLRSEVPLHRQPPYPIGDPYLGAGACIEGQGIVEHAVTKDDPLLGHARLQRQGVRASTRP